MASKKELKALITLAGKVDPSLQNALMKASAQTDKTSGKLAKLQSMASKGMAFVAKATVAGAVAGGAAMAALTVKATKVADELLMMKDKTGLSIEELQRLQYASGQLGADFEAVPIAMTALTKQMDAARKGSKETRAIFKSLGVDAVDPVTKKLRSQSVVFQETLIQLSKIENEAQRNALAFKLYGKGAADLLPLMNAGSGEIAKLAAEADKLGIVMSGDTVNALDNFGDTVDKLKASAMGAFNQIISKLLPKAQPYIDQFAQQLPGYLDKSIVLFGQLGSIIGFVSDNMDWLLPLVTGTAGALAAFSVINSVVGMYKLWQASTFAMTLAQSGLNAALLANPIGLIVAGIGLLIAAGVALWKNWDVIKAKAAQLGEAVKKAFSFFLEHTAIGQFMSLAGKVLGIGSKKAESSSTAAKAAGSIKPKGRFAYGGLATAPSITGEGPYPEWNIPAVKSQRSISLLNQAARDIGVAPAGGSSVQLVYNPVIHGGNKSELEPLLRQHKDELMMLLEEMFGEKARVAFG